MSAIHNFDSKMWACELNDVYVSATADVAVRIVVADADGVTRYDNVANYTPVAGKIYFGELSKLVNQAILLSAEMQTGIATSETSRAPRATVTMLIPGENITAQATVYYYAGHWRDGVGNMDEFPMQIDNARVTPTEKFWVWVSRTGNVNRRVSARVVYVYNGTRLEKTFNIMSYAPYERYAMVDCSLAALFSNRLTPDEWLHAKICNYDIVLWTDGQQTDQIHVTVDHNHYYSEMQFCFINSFGLPEMIAFHGDDEEEHEMDADYGQAYWRYVRLDADFWIEHTTNSGWLTREEKARALELHRSPEVVLFAETVIPVTITDVAAKFRKSKNEPESLDIKWRIADKRDIYEVDTATSMAGHGVFDRTFTLAFD